MGRIGIVSALRAETDSFVRGSSGHIRYTVLTCGMGLDAARLGAQRLVADGVDAIVSWGVAGALVPELKVGDVVVTTDILTPDGHAIPGAAPPPVKFVQPFADQTLVSAAHVVRTPAAKRELHNHSGAALVDMESSAIAQVCRDAGIACLAVRSILDRVEDTLSPALTGLIDAKGGVQLGALTARMVNNPLMVGALLGQGIRYRRALSGLRRAASALRCVAGSSGA